MNIIYYNEDRLFIFQYLSHCQSAAYTTSPYYHYVTRKSSAMNLSQKTTPQTVHFHGCIRPDDFTFGHIPHLYSTCFVGRLHKKFVLVLYPTLTGNPLQ